MKCIFQFPIKILLFLILAHFFLLYWMTGASADEHDHKRQRHHHEEEQQHRNDAPFSLDNHRGENKGNETTGLIAAFLFVSANITIFLSILVRALNRSTQISNATREHLRKINRNQKKYLMPVHYILNPFALAFGFIHFSLSYCRSSALPEWGLGGMAILIAVGLLIKFKILPPKMKKAAYLFHTSPLPLCILSITLFIGHGVID